MWSQRRQEPEYYIVTGRAYPRVIEGKNKTRHIRAHIGDRKRFYWDEAVRLSTATLDQVNGAEGKPLCYKHRRNDVVGQVHHTYLDADNNLKITAKIPARTERGRRVIAKIRAGKLNGFSVGYDNHFDPADKGIQNKDFHEISICRQPFFDGCNIENGVYAASENEGLFVPFEEVMESAPAPATQAVAPTPAGAQEPLPPTPAPNTDEQAKEFLKQLTLTKDKLKEAEQREKEYAARLARLQELEAKEELRAKEYAAMQQPKLEQFVARLEASKGGKKLDERVYKAYERTFCDPNLKGAFEDQWALHTAAVNAEAKQREQETLLKKMEEELKKKDTVMRDATHQMRSAAYVPVSAAAEQERMMKEDDEARRSVVSINASLKEKTHAVPAPHANELPFMEAYREMMSASVTASSGGGGGSAVPGMRTHTQAAPVHAHLFDPETGERQIYGMRADFPHLFDTMCEEKFGLVTSDLEPMVQMNEKRCWIDNSKRVDCLPGTGII